MLSTMDPSPTVTPFPKSSSMAGTRPFFESLPNNERKRILLLIYVHGFLGSEDSFHQFPRHVHDILTVTLAETHQVFTKIYPRYKSRGPLKTACQHFSQWLSPHESEGLDVIILSHSLGGFVAAEVALLSSAENDTLKHQILGLVNFDVPFLGLHPRVIATGIGRIFRGHKAEDVDESSPSHQPPEPENDPTFDPVFSNDVKLTQWQGWGGAQHFLSKYSQQLSRSILQYGFSYYDHAGCLNNYPGLLKRHAELCRLENTSQLQSDHPGTHRGARRVRFINYYTTTSDHGIQQHDLEQAKTRMDHLTASAAQADLGGFSTPSDEKKQGRAPSSIISSTSSMSSSDEKRGKDQARARKFCLIPKSSKNGLWVPLPMDMADEITAHQSIFLSQGSHYDHLVADTVTRIESWVQDKLIQQAILSQKPADSIKTTELSD
ncbi:hypothetical protein BJX76DRAFT_336167 [Aspergillus varians]